MDEKSLFREFLMKRCYPKNLISVEVAWVGQQKPGTAKRLMECINIIQEWLDERRERER